MTKQEFFALLCCPACKGDLHVRQDYAELSCPRCLFRFPVVDGIPVLFPCDVVVKLKDMFTRYWDSEAKAQLYDMNVEGADSIFGVYNHRSEIYGLTSYYTPGNLDLVLDAGCGNGRFLETLPQHSVSIGVDASLNLLRIAQKKGRGTFHVCCELEHLPFRDDLFGMVMSCRVIQHLKEQKRAAQELCRVTRARGSLILELYNTWNPKTLYKNIRMSKYRTIFNYPFKLLFRSCSPFDYWGLDYDKYNNWFQVKRWLKTCGMHGIRGRGVGFGYHKYLFEPLFINAILAKRKPGWLRSYYAGCLAVEKLIGRWIPFRYVMEKFVIAATKNAPELEGNVVGRVATKVNHAWKSSVFFNRAAFKEVEREQEGEDRIIQDHRFHIVAAVEWLIRAQDATPDRGVSRGYSVGWHPFFHSKGWQPSYPETTGYIIPTVFDCATYLNDDALRKRAIEMADWEIEVQLSNGAVMGGMVNTELPKPAVFNTGQVMIGWLRAHEETGDQRYLEACERAARYLVSVQNPDGTWFKGNSEFANARWTTYNTRVGWALILLGLKVDRGEYLTAGERNIESGLREQNPNGWFRNNCLVDPQAPLLHTICYAIEGIWGASEALGVERYHASGMLAVEHLLSNVAEDGRIPGRFDAQWKGTVTWNCLTGNAQLAVMLLWVFEKTKNSAYQVAAHRLLSFLKSTQNCVSEDPGLRGGIKGSFPFSGDYGRFETLNWATKFFIDALLLDEKQAKGQ